MRHTHLLVFAAFFVLGCGDDDNGSVDAGSIDGGSAADSSSSGATWSVAYTGDLTGEISGDITAVVPGGTLTTVIRGGTPDLDGPTLSATVFLPINETGDAEITTATVRLADGTECRRSMALPMIMGTVTAGATDNYAITFSGDLDCAGQTIAITAELISD